MAARRQATALPAVAAVVAASDPDALPSDYREPEVTAAPVAAAPAGVVTPVPSQATIAVTNWFSSTRSLLNQFDGPLAEALQTTLTGVQRTLFSPAPTVKAVQYTSWNPGDSILGALKYIQPGGAAVSMQLTQAPALGTVQLLSDGTYTYVPGPDFAGTDTFTAQVTSGGLNILEPFAPRTAEVTVLINPAPPVQASYTYRVTNSTSWTIKYKGLSVESGYEDAVEGQPAVGTVLNPGQSAAFELTYYAFYGYGLDASFEAGNGSAASNFRAQKWRVNIYIGDAFGGRFDFGCDTGNGVGCERPFEDPYNGQELFLTNDMKKITLNAADPTQSGEAAAVLSGYCDEGTNKCQLDLNSPLVASHVWSMWREVHTIGCEVGTSCERWSRTQTYQQSQSTSLQLKLSAGLAIGKIFKAGYESTSSESYTTTQTYSVTEAFDGVAGKNVTLWYRYPVLQLDGTMIVTLRNGRQIIVQNTVVTSPDTSTGAISGGYNASTTAAPLPDRPQPPAI